MPTMQRAIQSFDSVTLVIVGNTAISIAAVLWLAGII